MTNGTEINWVKIRNECSTLAMFAKLKLEIEQDINERNALRADGDSFIFRIVSNGSKFLVQREGNRLGKSFAFLIENEEIIATDDKGGVVLKASLTLNDKGECKFKIDGKERESWHLRKLVLEDLFFGSDLQ